MLSNTVYIFDLKFDFFLLFILYIRPSECSTTTDFATLKDIFTETPPIEIENAVRRYGSIALAAQELLSDNEGK